MIGSDIAKYAPDALDRAIIAHLRVDGRASLAKLAEAVGVARGTIQNRLDRLLATGTLTGFTVRVREDYDDNAVHAVMMIELVGKWTTQVNRKLRGLPEVRALHTTNGNWSVEWRVVGPQGVWRHRLTSSCGDPVVSGAASQENWLCCAQPVSQRAILL
ncbi:Lrp/AsnC family transcriptional regulator [Mesorhizobium ciceri]|uniref:Lrp/AsnC family transcriptional regulator n=1 Tax=Mesorhizobium ciceri TaxID=39645 RepID=UPI0009ED25C6|nr:Lrp/AsnC family transcriptional regulator [Mesorhizobium ciceri]